MGNVEQRGKNKFRLTVTIGYTDTGKEIRERRNVQARNRTEAKKELAKFESEILAGQYIRPEKMTLNELYENEWKIKYAPERLGVNTLQERQRIIEKRILPPYGKMAISDFKTIHVVNFMDDLKKDGRRLDGKDGKLSASTLTNCYKAFNSLFDCAKTYGLIKENPASSVSPPPPAKRAVKLNYSIDMLWELIDKIKDEPFDKQLIFWIAFVTSAREAEIVALEEKHVLIDQSAIQFSQSLYEKQGGGIGVKSIKNHLEGVAAVPPELMDMVQSQVHEKRKHRMKMGDRWQYKKNQLFVFSDEFGKPMRPDAVSKWWRKFIHKNNLEKIRFHDLRHLSITFLIGKNVPMKSISERARHSNIATTMDLYGHNIVDVDHVSASYFSEFFKTQTE